MKKELFVMILVVMSSIALAAMCFRIVGAPFEPGIYIKPDGSIVKYPIDGPPPIVRNGDVYALTADNGLPIIVQRSNIVLDGDGHTQGPSGRVGINVSKVANITIRDFTVSVGCLYLYCTGICSVDCSLINITNNAFSGNGIGIDLNGSQSSVVRNNSFYSNSMGIRVLSGCHDTEVSENSFSENGFAVWLEGDCDLSQIINNNIRGTYDVNNRDHRGIYACGSLEKRLTGCEISGNIIVNAELGVEIGSSSGINVAGNTFESSGLFVWDYSQGSIVYNNTVNGMPLVYLENATDQHIDEAGQVILVNCSRIRVENAALSSTACGAELLNTSSSVIANNNVTGNSYWGVYVRGASTNNTISGNNIEENKYAGIGLDENANSNTIARNRIAENSHNGIEIYSSSLNTVTNNNVTLNGRHGLEVSGSLTNVIGNTFTANGQCGMQFEGSSGAIFGNNIEGNANGLYMTAGDNNVIYHNNFVNNTVQTSVDSGINYWDNGLEGNYWSDYVGFDANLDGIGDVLHPYVISADNKDHYPLMGMFYEFNATPQQSIQAIYNSSASDFRFEDGAIRFDVFGEIGAVGFCRLCIPTTLTNDTYRVFVNGTEVSCTLLPCSTVTHDYLYFTYAVNASATQRHVLLRTDMGDILIELYNDMPITTANFINLTKMGTYDDTIFHRVVPSFIIQGGDPTGTGYGDPSISPIPDELPNLHSNVRGSVAMANKGPNTATSQFFINLGNNSFLDSAYVVFGRVIGGMDVVDDISIVPTIEGTERPLSDVTVTRAELFEYTTVEIVIIPEFPVPLVSLLLVLMTLFSMVVCKRRQFAG